MCVLAFCCCCWFCGSMCAGFGVCFAFVFAGFVGFLLVVDMFCCCCWFCRAVCLLVLCVFCFGGLCVCCFCVFVGFGVCFAFVGFVGLLCLLCVVVFCVFAGFGLLVSGCCSFFVGLCICWFCGFVVFVSCVFVVFVGLWVCWLWFGCSAFVYIAEPRGPLGYEPSTLAHQLQSTVPTFCNGGMATSTQCFFMLPPPQLLSFLAVHFMLSFPSCSCFPPSFLIPSSGALCEIFSPYSTGAEWRSG